MQKVQNLQEGLVYCRSKADVKVHGEILKDRMKPRNINKKAHSRINNSWKKKPQGPFLQNLKDNIERYLDEINDEVEHRKAHVRAVEIAAAGDVRRPRVPLHLGSREQLETLRPRSARRYEEQKVLSSEKDLSLSYVKRAIGMITPEFLRELSEEKQATDRDKQLCNTFADLLSLVCRNRLLNLDGWKGFRSFVQREGRVKEYLEAYLVHLEEADVSTLLLEQVRQAYKDCSGRRS